METSLGGKELRCLKIFIMRNRFFLNASSCSAFLRQELRLQMDTIFSSPAERDKKESEGRHNAETTHRGVCLRSTCTVCHPECLFYLCVFINTRTHIYHIQHQIMFSSEIYERINKSSELNTMKSFSRFGKEHSKKLVKFMISLEILRFK